MTHHAVGSLVLLISGEYSELDIDVLCRVLKPFETRATLEAFRVSWALPVPDHTYRVAPDEPTRQEFTLWLHTQGYVEDVPYDLWHLGCYGRLEDDEDDS